MRNTSPTNIVALQEYAKRQARRAGFSVEDSEDCAASFVLHCMNEQKSDLFSLPLHVQHFVLDYARVLARRRLHETNTRSGSGADANEATDASTPADAFWLMTCWNAFHEALSCLKPSSSEIVRRHLLLDESFVSIADALGKKPDAVRKSFDRACVQIRSHLEGRGWTEEECVLCLIHITKSPSRVKNNRGGGEGR